MILSRSRLDLLPERLSAWRRALHRCPEVGLDLPRTTACLQGELRAMGLEPVPVGRGFVVDLGPGPRVAWRADMDALPLQEQTGAPYASEHPGAMHACGHDAHMAVGLALAWLLADLQPQPAVRIIFQPDEEGLHGAGPLVEAGVLEGVEAVLGLHVGQLLEGLGPGSFALRTGIQMAAGDRFWATFKGRGTHGAQPHLGRDPLVAAAAYVGTLQTLVGRAATPGRLAVASVGTFLAGTSPNIIPESAALAGILRTELPGDRSRLVARLEEAARGIAAAHEVELEWTHLASCPAVRNDPAWAARARDAVRRVAGPGGLVEMQVPAATSDDIGFYLERVPGVYLFLGTNDPARGITEPNHSPRFEVAEDQLWKAVAYGVEMLAPGSWPDLPGEGRPAGS
jgi:amidohydrolase